MTQYLEGIDHDGIVTVHAEHPVHAGEGLCGARKSFPPGYQDGTLSRSSAERINCKDCCQLIRSMAGVRMAPTSELR